MKESKIENIKKKEWKKYENNSRINLTLLLNLNPHEMSTY